MTNIIFWGYFLISLTIFSVDGTFLPWSVDLGKHILSQHPLPEGLEPLPSDMPLPPKFELIINDTMAGFNSREFCGNPNLTEAEMRNLQALDNEKPRTPHGEILLKDPPRGPNGEIIVDERLMVSGTEFYDYIISRCVTNSRYLVRFN